MSKHNNNTESKFQEEKESIVQKHFVMDTKKRNKIYENVNTNGKKNKRIMYSGRTSVVMSPRITRQR